MRITDGQLAQWLYDAEFDWSADDAWTKMTPADSFPPYYDDDYRPTLAALFRELLHHRQVDPT